MIPSLIIFAKALACVACTVFPIAIVAGFIDQRMAERYPDRKPASWRDLG